MFLATLYVKMNEAEELKNKGITKAN